MSNLRDYLWLIPTLPLLAAVVTAFLGPRLLRGASHWPCILVVAASCVLSFSGPSAVSRAGPIPAAGPPGSHPSPPTERYYTWVQIGDVDVGFTLRADGLSAIMLVTVTFISMLIAV